MTQHRFGEMGASTWMITLVAIFFPIYFIDPFVVTPDRVIKDDDKKGG